METNLSFLSEAPGRTPKRTNKFLSLKVPSTKANTFSQHILVANGFESARHARKNIHKTNLINTYETSTRIQSFFLTKLLLESTLNDKLMEQNYAFRRKIELLEETNRDLETKIKTERVEKDRFEAADRSLQSLGDDSRRDVQTHLRKSINKGHKETDVQRLLNGFRMQNNALKQKVEALEKGLSGVSHT